MKVRGGRLPHCFSFLPGSQGPPPTSGGVSGLGFLAKEVAGTGGTEEGGEGNWLINLHLGDSLGIFSKDSSRVEVGVF